MVKLSTLKKGLQVGASTTWSLAKVIFPITVLVSILNYTPVIDWIVYLFTPLMGWFGLPGDAAIVLALGNMLNLYAAIGAILTMQLTVKSVFILAMMLSLSHNLLVETAITSRIGVKAWVIALIRLGLACVSAILINFLWQGGQEIASYGLISQDTAVVEGWFPIVLNALQTAFLGVLQIAAIVIPLMVGIQILKEGRALSYLAKFLGPFTRLLKISDPTAIPLMAGLIFGIAYGAGVIIQAAKEENLTKRDLYLVSVFLVVCHAVVEDTLIFYPLGVNIWLLLGIRLVLAIIITIATAKIWIRLSPRAMKLPDPHLDPLDPPLESHLEPHSDHR